VKEDALRDERISFFVKEFEAPPQVFHFSVTSDKKEKSFVENFYSKLFPLRESLRKKVSNDSRIVHVVIWHSLRVLKLFDTKHQLDVKVI
jgi:hypothetical protein